MVAALSESATSRRGIRLAPSPTSAQSRTSKRSPACSEGVSTGVANSLSPSPLYVSFSSEPPSLEVRARLNMSFVCLQVTARSEMAGSSPCLSLRSYRTEATTFFMRLRPTVGKGDSPEHIFVPFDLRSATRPDSASSSRADSPHLTLDFFNDKRRHEFLLFHRCTLGRGRRIPQR